MISWFEETGRDLPWRRTRDPYRVLVSEVMLQQIQVVRAIPFYERFLERFPTVEALANAPISDAIRVWGDLGRYRRVVNLHRTARTIVDEHGGEVPSDGTSFSARASNVGSFAVGSGTSGPTKTRCSTRRMLVSMKGTPFGKSPTTRLTLTLVALR